MLKIINKTAVYIHNNNNFISRKHLTISGNIYKFKTYAWFNYTYKKF